MLIAINGRDTQLKVDIVLKNYLIAKSLQMQNDMIALNKLIIYIYIYQIIKKLLIKLFFFQAHFKTNIIGD